MARVDISIPENAILSGILPDLGYGAESAWVARALDVIIGVAALIASLPLLLICAVIIKLASRGSVIYTQMRVGKGGELFKMYKLRTMHNGSEANGAVWADDDDPRVVRTCRWMRMGHIDELPQLINVIRGEMALVGPRPERAEILDDLAQLYPNINRRLDVLPGITGLAQIRWGYDTTPARFRRKLQADLEYIRNKSWRMNLQIMARTVPKFFDRTAK